MPEERQMAHGVPYCTGVHQQVRRHDRADELMLSACTAHCHPPGGTGGPMTWVEENDCARMPAIA